MTVRRIRLLLFVLGAVVSISIPGNARQSQNGADYFVQAAVNIENPYIGQQIWYRFELYDAVGLPDPMYEGPDFEGFWRSDLDEPRQFMRKIDERLYSVIAVETVLFPAREGDLIIPGGSLILPETVFRPRQVISANPVTVHVRPLPPAAPSGYGGAVGAFTITSRLLSSRENQYPVLQLEIEGTGNIAQLDPPKPDLPSDWSFNVREGPYTESFIDGQLHGQQVLDYVLVPGPTSLDYIPPISLPYFDPVTAIYKMVQTTRVEMGTTDMAFSSPASSPDRRLDLLWVDHSDALALSDSPLPWGMLGVPPLILLGAFGWRWRRRSLERRRPALLREQAMRAAADLLKSAKLAPDHVQGGRTLLLAVQTYFAHRLSVRPSHLTLSDIVDGLRKHKVPAPTIGALMTCVEQIYQALYAPSDAGHSALIDRTQQALNQVHENWR